MATDTEQVIIDIKVDYEDAIYGVQRFKDQIAALKNEQEKLRDDLRNGTKTSEEYRLAMTKNEEAIKQAKSQMREMSREVQNTLKVERETGKQIDIMQASYNQLSATYAQMKTRINEMSAAQREANREYIDSSRKVYEQMKKLQEETGKHQLNVGNYENAILRAVGANGNFSRSILAITSNSTTINGAFTSMGTAVKGFGASLMSLMANPVFLAIAGIAAVGAAFKFWSEYNNGISEATRLTREFLYNNGIVATNEQLRTMRSEIQAIADTYDKDYKETLQGVDTLMSQFGISAKEAMDILNKGFAAGADLNGDMLSQIKQFAPALSDAGVSASELVALIQQTRSGIFSREGMNMIVKASKSLRDMSDSTRSALQSVGVDADNMARKLSEGQITMLEAIRQVSAGLQTVGVNSQEAGAIIDNVFGRQGTAAGQKQIEAIAGINTGLEQVMQTTGEYGQLQLQIEENQKQINQYTEALFGMEGWDVMKKRAELYATQALEQVLRYLVDVANSFIKVYNNSAIVRASISAIGTTFTMTYKVVRQVLKNIADGLRGLGMMLEGITERNWGKFESGLNAILSTPVNLYKGVANAVVDGIKDGINAANNGHLNPIELEVEPVVDYSKYNQRGVGGSGGSGGGSGTGSGGGSRGGTNADNKAEQDAKRRKQLEEALQRELDNIIIKGEQDRTKQINMEYDKRIADTRAKYAELGDAVQPLIDKIEAERKETIAKNDAEIYKKAVEERQKLIQLELSNQQAIADNEKFTDQQRLEASKMAFDTKIAALAIQQQMEREQYEGNQAMLTAIDKKYQLERIAAFQQYSTQTNAINQATVDEQMKAMETQANGYASVLGSMGKMLGDFGEQSKEAAIASKVLAVAQIAIEQGVAIAKATSAGAGLPFPANIAAIASGIAAVVSAILSATKATKKAKFAEGGLVRGEGTGTSDSIPAMLSNGESVINARSTKAFAPLLSAMNIAGGGVPINMVGGSTDTMGEAMLSRSFTAALREMPTPVVAVSEIERVENRVKVIENFSQL